MKLRIALMFFCLATLTPADTAGEKPPAAAIHGEWHSSLSRAPGSADCLIQRTLRIGEKDNPDAVRLSWSMYCGASRITGGDDYVGRVLSVTDKGKKRVIQFAGEKNARYEVEFEQVGDELRLTGAIKGIDVTDGWKRKPAKK